MVLKYNKRDILLADRVNLRCRPEYVKYVPLRRSGARKLLDNCTRKSGACKPACTNKSLLFHSFLKIYMINH